MRHVAAAVAGACDNSSRCNRTGRTRLLTVVAMRARGSSCAGSLRAALCALAVLLVAALPSRALAHGDDIVEIASTANGGGSLVALYDFGTALEPTLSLSASGFSIYTTIYPSFGPTPADDVPASTFVLDNNVPLRLEVVSVGGCPPASPSCV